MPYDDMGDDPMGGPESALDESEEAAKLARDIARAQDSQDPSSVDEDILEPTPAD